MKQTFIFIIILVGTYLPAQIHNDLKPMPDIIKEGYAKVYTAFKVTEKSQTECTATVYSDEIIVECGSLIQTFSAVYPEKVYRDNKGKLIEAVKKDGYFILVPTKTTSYWIKLK